MILEALDDIAETHHITLSDFYKYVISNEDSYVKAIKAAIESIREDDVSNYQYTIPTSVTLGKVITSATRYLYSASPIECKKTLGKSPEELWLLIWTVMSEFFSGIRILKDSPMRFVLLMIIGAAQRKMIISTPILLLSIVTIAYGFWKQKVARMQTLIAKLQKNILVSNIISKPIEAKY